MTTVHINYLQLYTISFSTWRKLNTSLKVICIQLASYSVQFLIFLFFERILLDNSVFM